MAVRTLRLSALVLVLAAGLALPGVAAGADPGFLDQYQEPFPIGGGNDYTGSEDDDDRGSGGGIELPASTETKLDNSVSEPVAKALKDVATSSKLGAPGRMLTDEPGGSAATSSLSEAISTSAEPENPYLLVVLLGLAAITFAGAAAVVARRRVAARSD